MAAMTDLLARLETYYDEVPRAGSEVEEHGPFTVFVSTGGWPYYARPRLGAADFASEDVTAVLARLRERGQPESIEWVHESSPSLRSAAQAAGCTVHEYPLLVLDGAPVERRSPCDVRRLDAGDQDLAVVRAAIHVGFSQDDTLVGDASVAERDELAAGPDTDVEHLSTVLAAGRSVTYGAFDPELGAVGGGSHNPRGSVTEIVGVGVLPASRRRGIAGHLTWVLTEDAMAAGVTTVFMSAGSEAVARIYEGVGYRRVGTACIVG